MMTISRGSLSRRKRKCSAALPWFALPRFEKETEGTRGRSQRTPIYWEALEVTGWIRLKLVPDQLRWTTLSLPPTSCALLPFRPLSRGTIAKLCQMTPAPFGSCLGFDASLVRVSENDSVSPGSSRPQPTCLSGTGSLGDGEAMMPHKPSSA